MERISSNACVVQKKMKRDAILILLDEFDVISNKSGLGSLIKTLSSEYVKFGICGIGRDLSDLVEDHNSVEPKDSGLESSAMARTRSNRQSGNPQIHSVTPVISELLQS
jgi:hypothetical protein